VALRLQSPAAGYDEPPAANDFPILIATLDH
jgi:hypothetical protein